ncbi:MAG TPA: 50S ribosomal protein L6 [Candidatus Hydrogenedentes bacterium]|nr:50S ribosomal protein L6 [Candidatus Hydrogenedentota bacterium]HRK34944.1 50S ribosomal protein L6 [Candidatus Hydrogenedentota bacterium]
MSRIGKLPVVIPGGVKVDLNGNRLKVTGPKGNLERVFHPDVTVTVEGSEIAVTRPSDSPAHRALHGLTRALIQNMVEGVTTGYTKTLQIVGVGYRAAMQGKSLQLLVGYSHPVIVEPPAGVAFTVEGTQTIKVEGIDKELVGQVAADIRRWRQPEPYKGKGIKYENEFIRRKEGKAGGK